MYTPELSAFVDSLKNELRSKISAYSAYCSEENLPEIPNYSPDGLAALYAAKNLKPSGIDWKIVAKDIEVFIAYRMQEWEKGKEEKARHYCSLL